MASGEQPPSGAKNGAPSSGEGLSRYVKVQDLSRGAFGRVVLARATVNNELVALKYMPLGPQHISKYTEREIVNHMKLRHPHVIGLREVFLTATHLVLVMEYAAGGDLARYVATRQGLPETEARRFFQQLIVAVDYCHRMGVSSRDIKLENVLVDGSPRPLIKLADFGFSKDANQHSAPASRCGTPAYLAPEVVRLQNGQKYDGQKADIWSCGVLLFAMLTNTYPFRRAWDDGLSHQEKLQALLGRVLKADYSFPPDPRLSDGVKDLIRRILVVEPEQRPSIQDIMAHPWFVEGLSPAVLSYNDAVVQLSRESQPPQEVIEEVRLLVKQAAAGPPAGQLELSCNLDAIEGHVEGAAANPS